VSSANGSTGLITMYWSPANGFTKTVIGSTTQITFPVDIGYPLIDQQCGFTETDFDAYENLTEGFSAVVPYPTALGNPLNASLSLAIQTPRSHDPRARDRTRRRAQAPEEGRRHGV
jgi:hypothetical protein